MICSYAFNDFQNANHIARELAVLGATDIKLIRPSEKYRVKFNASWSIEQQLIHVATKEAGQFRTSSPSTKEERALIRDMYCCWHHANEFESVLRRSWSSVARILEGEGLLFTYANKDFVYDSENFFTTWEEGFSPTTGFSVALVEMLQAVGVLDRSLKQFMESDDYAYYPVKALSRDEVENLFSLLRQAGMWEQGQQLAPMLEDQVITARLQREFGNQDPIEFFRILEHAEGLPMEILYQRELARAYWAWNLIEGYSKMVARWLGAAKLRVADYYDQESIYIPHPLRHPDLRIKNPIVHALNAIDDESRLESLANNENNQMAAAILADMHRLRMKKSDYPLDAADHWNTLQDGYWPTQLEIHDAIAACIVYDQRYAKKMEHIGFTYWALQNP